MKFCFFFLLAASSAVVAGELKSLPPGASDLYFTPSPGILALQKERALRPSFSVAKAALLSIGALQEPSPNADEKLPVLRLESAKETDFSKLLP